MSRPAYNTSTGFYIGSDMKLYDASNVEFHIKGTNRVHYDNAAGTTGKLYTAGLNALRFVLYWQNGTTPAQFKTQLTDECYAHGIVAIPGTWTTADAYGPQTLTCNTGTTSIRAAYDEWEDMFLTWNGTENWLIVNPANEWGPVNNIIWRDEHITGIARLRAAGYLHTLMIDSGGCGQDFPDLINYAQAVFDSDPQKNIIFGIHFYGENPAPTYSYGNAIIGITNANPAVVSYSGSNYQYLNADGRQIIITQASGMTEVNSTDGTNGTLKFFKTKNVNTVAKTFELTNTSDVNIDSTGYGVWAGNGRVGPNAGQAAIQAKLQTLVDFGLPLVIGEFGPGHAINNQTMHTAGQIITSANNLNVGWLSWGWDDNFGSPSYNYFYKHVYDSGVYESSSDLTDYGKVIVDDPVYGWLASAVKANFTSTPLLGPTITSRAVHRRDRGRRR